VSQPGTSSLSQWRYLNHADRRGPARPARLHFTPAPLRGAPERALRNATASLVSRSRRDGCFTPAMHKPSRSRPSGSARYRFSTRSPTPRARIDRRVSAIRVSGSRRAIAGVASCPPLLCHGCSNTGGRLLLTDAVVEPSTTAPRGRSSALSRLPPWQTHSAVDGDLTIVHTESSDGWRPAPTIASHAGLTLRPAIASSPRAATRIGDAVPSQSTIALPGEGSSPRLLARSTRPWRTRSLTLDQSSATTLGSFAPSGLRIVRAIQSSHRARRDLLSAWPRSNARRAAVRTRRARGEVRRLVQRPGCAAVWLARRRRCCWSRAVGPCVARVLERAEVLSRVSGRALTAALV